MPAKCSDADFDNAVQAYIAGESVENTATRFHTSQQRLADYLKAHGLLRDKASRYKIIGEKCGATRRALIPLPEAEIAARYLAGESENTLARCFGVSRSAITTRLRVAGVQRRDMATANRLAQTAIPIEEHHRRIKIAQDAVRGRRVSIDEKIRRAIGREAKGSNRSASEILLEGWLIDRGISTVPQKAIGIYNVDLGAYPVAVEIFGGSWHATKHTHTERTRYILNQGWHLVVIWTHPRRSPLVPAVADYIVTFLQEVSSKPTAIREYRVIRGDGQELARGRFDGNDISLVVPGYEGCSGGTRYQRARS